MNYSSDDQLLEALKARLEDHRNTIAKTGRLMVQLELLNKKLQESESLKSNFLSNIRNEINNPLTVLLGFSKTLILDKELDRSQIEKIGNTIFRESFILQLQFQNIFQAADLEAGDIVIDPANIELPNFFKSVTENFKHLLDEKNQNCNMHSDIGDQHNFLTDPVKYHLIISNLLDNAIKFSSQNSYIDFVYRMINNKLVVSIQDQGPGIDEVNHERIFDRFVQLDSGATKQYRGHGLGLSVVRELVRLLGGDIQVNSHLGGGTRVTVTIPQVYMETEVNVVSEDGNEELFTDSELF